MSFEVHHFQSVQNFASTINTLQSLGTNKKQWIQIRQLENPQNSGYIPALTSRTCWLGRICQRLFGKDKSIRCNNVSNFLVKFFEVNQDHIGKLVEENDSTFRETLSILKNRFSRSSELSAKLSEISGTFDTAVRTKITVSKQRQIVANSLPIVFSQGFELLKALPAASKVAQDIAEWLAPHFQKFKNDKEFEDLPPSTLAQVLSHDLLDIKSEEELEQYLQDLAKKRTENVEDRQKFLSSPLSTQRDFSLIDCVRFENTKFKERANAKAVVENRSLRGENVCKVTIQADGSSLLSFRINEKNLPFATPEFELEGGVNMRLFVKKDEVASYGYWFTYEIVNPQEKMRKQFFISADKSMKNSALFNTYLVTSRQIDASQKVGHLFSLEQWFGEALKQGNCIKCELILKPLQQSE